MILQVPLQLEQNDGVVGAARHPCERSVYGGWLIAVHLASRDAVALKAYLTS